jgi:hypothetical protein
MREEARKKKENTPYKILVTMEGLFIDKLI